MTNCPNCGGEFNINEDKCVYFGAPILDIAAIEVDKPSIIKLYSGGKIISVKGVARAIHIEHCTPDVSPEMCVDFDLYF